MAKSSLDVKPELGSWVMTGVGGFHMFNPPKSWSWRSEPGLYSKISFYIYGNRLFCRFLFDYTSGENSSICKYMCLYMYVNGYSEPLLVYKLKVTKAKLPPQKKPPILKVKVKRWNKYVTHTKNQRHGEQEMIPNRSHKITILTHLEKQSGLPNELRQAVVAPC